MAGKHIMFFASQRAYSIRVFSQAESEVISQNQRVCETSKLKLEDLIGKKKSTSTSNRRLLASNEKQAPRTQTRLTGMDELDWRKIRRAATQTARSKFHYVAEMWPPRRLQPSASVKDCHCETSMAVAVETSSRFPTVRLVSGFSRGQTFDHQALTRHGELIEQRKLSLLH